MIPVVVSMAGFSIECSDYAADRGSCRFNGPLFPRRPSTHPCRRASVNSEKLKRKEVRTTAPERVKQKPTFVYPALLRITLPAPLPVVPNNLRT